MSLAHPLTRMRGSIRNAAEATSVSGTAVVASEVKKLAKQTADSTDEIAHNIVALTTSAQGTIAKVAEIVSSSAALSVTAGELTDLVQKFCVAGELSQ